MRKGKGKEGLVEKENGDDWWDEVGGSLGIMKKRAKGVGWGPLGVRDEGRRREESRVLNLQLQPIRPIQLRLQSQ